MQSFQSITVWFSIVITQSWLETLIQIYINSSPCSIRTLPCMHKSSDNVVVIKNMMKRMVLTSSRHCQNTIYCRYLPCFLSNFETPVCMLKGKLQETWIFFIKRKKAIAKVAQALLSCSHEDTHHICFAVRNHGAESRSNQGGSLDRNSSRQVDSSSKGPQGCKHRQNSNTCYVNSQERTTAVNSSVYTVSTSLNPRHALALQAPEDSRFLMCMGKARLAPGRGERK